MNTCSCCGNKLVAAGESAWDKGTGQSAYRDRNLRPNPAGRNKRTVWTIPTASFKGGTHFAVMPPKLVEPCILAGTSEKGCCPKCGAPYARVTERIGANKPDEEAIRDYQAKGVPRTTANLYATKTRGYTKTIGWRPACDCNAGEPVSLTPSRERELRGWPHCNTDASSSALN